MQGVYILLDDPKNVQRAVELAVSIRYHSPEVHITLLHEKGLEAGLQPNELELFSKLTPLKKSDKNPLKNIHKYFTQKECIYIDIKSIALKNIEELFTLLDGNQVVCDGDYFLYVKNEEGLDTEGLLEQEYKGKIDIVSKDSKVDGKEQTLTKLDAFFLNYRSTTGIKHAKNCRAISNKYCVEILKRPSYNKI